MAKYVNLEDSEVVYCGSDGDYEKYNIPYDMPTADVVEVVRCEKCFYAIPYNERWTLPKKNNCMWCKRYEDVRQLDWFCADAERRDDAKIY